MLSQIASILRQLHLLRPKVLIVAITNIYCKVYICSWGDVFLLQSRNQMIWCEKSFERPKQSHFKGKWSCFFNFHKAFNFIMSAQSELWVMLIWCSRKTCKQSSSQVLPTITFSGTYLWSYGSHRYLLWWFVYITNLVHFLFY